MLFSLYAVAFFSKCREVLLYPSTKRKTADEKVDHVERTGVVVMATKSITNNIRIKKKLDVARFVGVLEKAQESKSALPEKTEKAVSQFSAKELEIYFSKRENS